MLQLTDAQVEYVLGRLWEEKHRGGIPLLIPGGVLSTLLQAYDQSLTLDSPAVPSFLPQPPEEGWSGWPNEKVGWGSYGWKYDESIPMRAIALGAQFIDTAEGYGFGRVEKELGNILREYSREQRGVTRIATKVARSHLSKGATLNAGRRSREKLQVDYIDLYQIHWPVLDQLPETLEAIAQLKQEGVIDQLGVCNFGIRQLIQAATWAKTFGLRIASNQIPVNAATNYCKTLVAWCSASGIEVIGHSPFEQKTPSAGAKEVLGGLLAQGVRPIPGTNSVKHLEENLSLNVD